MFKLPELPYAYDALQPVVSEITMRTHHDKHHKAYVDALNGMMEGKDLGAATLEAVVKQAKASGEQKLFNQSGQAWNHAFFWESMTPGGGSPQGALAEAIEACFGGLDKLKAGFVAEGVGHFASGWVWLAADAKGALSILSTHDADTLLVKDGVSPLLVCDLWEHAYYLDYKNLRKAFLEAWFDGVANWGFAEAQLLAARRKGEPYAYPAQTDQARAA